MPPGRPRPRHRHTALAWVAAVLLGLVGSAPAAAAEARIVRASRTGDGLRLALDPAVAPGWASALVGRLVVRTSAGQRDLAVGPLPRSPEMDLVAPAAGCALVVADVGRAGAGVSRCSKILVCGRASREALRAATALATEKVGSAIEVRPLFNPATLVPGADLAVRLYLGGAERPGALVEALGPGELVESARSGSYGIANLHIAAAGEWVVRYAEGGLMAELAFEVADLPRGETP